MTAAFLPVADAQAALLALTQLLDPIILPASDALGHYLATPLQAKRTQPAADLSAMDGYAMCVLGDHVSWKLVGESAAGSPYAGTLSAGTCVRISTGAALPKGANAILIHEHALRVKDTITLCENEGPSAKWIRCMGQDFDAGDVLHVAGRRVTPAIVGLAHMAGCTTIAVRPPPHIAILSTGSELCADSPLYLPDANGPMLVALIREQGVLSQHIPPVPDTLDAIIQAFQACTYADIIVTTGGVSVGDHDLIVPALKALGADIAFWKIAMRPGKPMLIAQLGTSIILGLPGNPVSAFVTAQLFLLPLIRQMMGAANPMPTLETAHLAVAMPGNDSRETYVRAVVENDHVTALADQDSALLCTLSQANCLIQRDPCAPSAAIGDTVCVIRI